MLMLKFALKSFPHSSIFLARRCFSISKIFCKLHRIWWNEEWKHCVLFVFSLLVLVVYQHPGVCGFFRRFVIHLLSPWQSTTFCRALYPPALLIFQFFHLTVALCTLMRSRMTKNTPIIITGIPFSFTSLPPQPENPNKVKREPEKENVLVLWNTREMRDKNVKDLTYFQLK